MHSNNLIASKRRGGALLMDSVSAVKLMCFAGVRACDVVIKIYGVQLLLGRGGGYITTPTGPHVWNSRRWHG